MSAEIRWSPTAWKEALESENAEALTTSFSTIVGLVAEKIHKGDASVLKSIDELYQATVTAAPSSRGSFIASSAAQTAVQLVKGLHMAVHGYFDYEKLSAPKELSYDGEFSQIQRTITHGDQKAAEEMFKKISSLILHGQLHVDSYADLGLKPAEIQLELRNWASALGMLARS